MLLQFEEVLFRRMGVEFKISFLLSASFECIFLVVLIFRPRIVVFWVFLNEVLHRPVHSVMETVQHNRNDMRI